MIFTAQKPSTIFAASLRKGAVSSLLPEGSAVSYRTRTRKRALGDAHLYTRKAF